MKQKKIGIIVLLMITSMMLTACGNKNIENQEEMSESSTLVVENSNHSSSVLYSKDGVDIKSVAVVLVGDTPNFQIVFANSTSADVEFDCSKFLIKSADGDEYKISALNRTVPANASYRQHSFTFRDNGKLKEGDLVTVYYDSQVIKDVEVTIF